MSKPMGRERVLVDAGVNDNAINDIFLKFFL